MAELIQSKGKQIEDHSLEILDLPLAPAPDTLLLSNSSNIYSYVTGDTFITSKISDGSESNRIWSASKSTTVMGDVEAALDAILGV